MYPKEQYVFILDDLEGKRSVYSTSLKCLVFHCSMNKCRLISIQKSPGSLTARDED